MCPPILAPLDVIRIAHWLYYVECIPNLPQQTERIQCSLGRIWAKFRAPSECQPYGSRSRIASFRVAGDSLRIIIFTVEKQFLLPSLSTFRRVWRIVYDCV